MDPRFTSGRTHGLRGNASPSFALDLVDAVPGRVRHQQKVALAMPGNA
jgi:hypothetical protein